MTLKLAAILSTVATAAMVLASAANAADLKPFTAAAFDAASKAGKSILVEVHAPWCPTCKAQKPIINELTSAPAYKDLVILDVDFDTQKDALQQFKVQKQSTLIAFKGATETARTVGDTKPDGIAALLKSTK